MKRETCRVELQVDIRTLAKIASYLQKQKRLPIEEGCISTDVYPISGNAMKIPKDKIASEGLRAFAAIISKESWTFEESLQILTNLKCNTNGFEDSCQRISTEQLEIKKMRKELKI